MVSDIVSEVLSGYTKYIHSSTSRCVFGCALSDTVIN